MKSREFQMLLSRATGATIGEVDQRTRFLRAAGELRTGKRGPWAPDIEPVEAACMLIAMTSRRATDAGSVFAKANTLPAVPREIGGKAFLQSATLGSVIASILTAPADWSESFAVDRIEIEESGEFAWLRIAAMSILFSADQKLRDWVAEFPDTYDSQYCGSAQRCFVIGGGLLEQVALEIADHDDTANYAEA